LEVHVESKTDQKEKLVDHIVPVRTLRQFFPNLKLMLEHWFNLQLRWRQMNRCRASNQHLLRHLSDLPGTAWQRKKTQLDGDFSWKVTYCESGSHSRATNVRKQHRLIWSSLIESKHLTDRLLSQQEYSRHAVARVVCMLNKW